MDASLISTPRQRNTEAEKVEIKVGRVPLAWRKKPVKLRQKDRDARWTLVFGKARLRADGTRRADAPSRSSEKRAMPASTAAPASSASGTSLTPAGMAGGCCVEVCWTRPTPAPRPALTAPTDRGRTKRSWRSTASASSSSTASRRAGRWRPTSAMAMLAAPRSAPPPGAPPAPVASAEQTCSPATEGCGLPSAPPPASNPVDQGAQMPSVPAKIPLSLRHLVRIRVCGEVAEWSKARPC